MSSMDLLSVLVKPFSKPFRGDVLVSVGVATGIGCDTQGLEQQGDKAPDRVAIGRSCTMGGDAHTGDGHTPCGAGTERAEDSREAPPGNKDCEGDLATSVEAGPRPPEDKREGTPGTERAVTSSERAVASSEREVARSELRTSL
jgi:hypothetical protein